jgi:hypothetical protein
MSLRLIWFWFVCSQEHRLRERFDSGWKVSNENRPTITDLNREALKSWLHLVGSFVAANRFLISYLLHQWDIPLWVIDQEVTKSNTNEKWGESRPTITDRNRRSFKMLFHFTSPGHWSRSIFFSFLIRYINNTTGDINESDEGEPGMNRSVREKRMKSDKNCNRS